MDGKKARGRERREGGKARERRGMGRKEKNLTAWKKQKEKKMTDTLSYVRVYYHAVLTALLYLLAAYHTHTHCASYRIQKNKQREAGCVRIIGKQP